MQGPRASRTRGPDRPAWNHKALISPGIGRGRYLPPPPKETIFCPCGQEETRPMLPARSALAPGPNRGDRPIFLKNRYLRESYRLPPAQSKLSSKNRDVKDPENHLDFSPL